MRARHMGFGLALTLMAATALQGYAATREETCAQLFRAYDRAVLLGSSAGQLEDSLVGRNVEPRAQRLIEVGCITRERDLAGIEALRGDLAADLSANPASASGAPIARTWLHVGIVPGIATELQVRGLFGALDIGVRGIGAPTLGRRIFVGPFTTAGGLAEATEIARRAGFVAPYPRRFGT